MNCPCYEDGSHVGKQSWEYHDVNRLGLVMLDWFEGNEVNNAWIVPDNGLERAAWPAPGSPPLPIGIVSIVAKSPQELDYTASGGFASDFRNRGWLHAPPTNLGGTFLANPTDLSRANSAYQLHFTAVNGDLDVSQYLEANGHNAYYGGGYSSSLGQTHVTALDLPTAPIRSLGAFAGVQVLPARSPVSQLSDTYSSPRVLSPSGNNEYKAARQYFNHKLLAVSGAAFGSGIGNAYAHPMIDPEEVYTRNDFGVDPGWVEDDGSVRNTNRFALNDDYWDHLFLANEELWDSWFCSGIAPVTEDGNIVTSKQAVATAFFSDIPTTPLSPHFRPYLRDKTVAELATLVETTTAATGENGWDLIGSHMLNRGQFNVNSTSKEAWKAVLMSLANRPIATFEPDSGTSVLPGDEDKVSLSRHTLADGQGDAWRGIRKLAEPQINKLAEEIVRQVKLRGPFLNMADFINRRLSSDEMGVTGALQAAIDWDEFNAGYNGTTSGSGESINGEYKSGDAMIRSSDLPATYPNPKAAMGSRYAGIPGYVMQSDLLQGISSSISVRGDTFTIRAYGETIGKNGEIAARVWCEAVIQRMPEYVNSTDAPAKKLRFAETLPNVLPSNIAPLHLDNQRFGRRFKMTSFRWLDQNEI